VGEVLNENTNNVYRQGRAVGRRKYGEVKNESKEGSPDEGKEKRKKERNRAM
jgi:hypothetical protein